MEVEEHANNNKSSNGKEDQNSPSMESSNGKEDQNSPSMESSNGKENQNSPSMKSSNGKENQNFPSMESSNGKEDQNSPSMKSSNGKEDQNSPLLESSNGKEKQNSPFEGCPKGGVEFIESSNGKEILTTINSIPIYRNFVNNLPYNPDLKKYLKAKRKMGILSEVLFWLQVHKNKFHKIDFDRQRIIGNYIVDFYVKSLGLVIEIDGASHLDKVEYDAIRQEFLESCGLKVYRISDLDVKINLNSVMLDLEEYIIRGFSNQKDKN